LYRTYITTTTPNMSLPTKSTQVVLAERPGKGSIKPSTFRQETASIPELTDGQVLVRVDYVSIVCCALRQFK
jgi:NADPH-dependent curcumin reductase CurA